jgi:hypothetical protein
MRQFATAVVERKTVFTEDFVTHPYECGWASEAIFFVHAEEASGDGARLEARIQISPDGVHWIDEGTPPHVVAEEGRSFVRTAHFGGWLRLACTVTPGSRFKLTIQLALKE